MFTSTLNRALRSTRELAGFALAGFPLQRIVSRLVAYSRSSATDCLAETPEVYRCAGDSLQRRQRDRMLAPSSLVKNSSRKDVEAPLREIERVNSSLVFMGEESEHIDLGVSAGFLFHDVGFGIPPSLSWNNELDC